MHNFSPLAVNHDDVAVLQRRLEEPGASAGHVRRVLIVLLSATGLDPSSIARELGCDLQTVVTWRERYRAAGAAGLADAPRSGRPTSVSTTTIVLRTLEPPPRGYARWTSRLLAAELGVSNVSVANAWRAWGVRPTRDGHVALATEPALAGVFSAVVGLCLRPPTAVLALEQGSRWGGGLPQVPVARRPDLRDRLPDLDGEHCAAAARDEEDVRGEVRAFVRGLANRSHAAGRRPNLALLVTGLSAPVAQACAEPGVGVFVAAPAVPWARLARVACLVAAGEADGRASVAALGDTLRRDGRAPRFTWIRERSGG